MTIKEFIEKLIDKGWSEEAAEAYAEKVYWR